MVKGPLETSEFRGVWLFAMFDLPVTTDEARKEYARFRKALLTEGFAMLQFSVYARYFGDEEASREHRKRLRAVLPPEGQVRLLTVTDKQFSKMEVFNGRRREETEEPPPQMMLL